MSAPFSPDSDLIPLLPFPGPGRRSRACLDRVDGFDTSLSGGIHGNLLPQLPQPVKFRFFADLDIQIQPKELSGFTKKQKTLLLAIIVSPATLRRIGRMAVETDLSDITGRQLRHVFEGASNKEILDCVLPCLPDIEKNYWESLRDGPGDTLHNEIVPVFLAFEVTFRRAGLEELSAES